MKKLLTLLLFLSSAAVFADGKQILEGECMLCHVVDGKGGQKLAAPPMYAVWHHYRQAYPEKEAFVGAISAWLQQPNKAQAEMKGAVKKFGLMDKLDISKEQAQSVAEYLYDRSFNIPGWYLTHYNQKHGTKEHGYDGNERHAGHHGSDKHSD